MYRLIPALVSSMLLALGLSYLFQARRWLRLMRAWAAAPERLFPIAIAMLAAGVVIGIGFDSWHGTWPVFITVLGWLLALEGAALLLAPGLVARLLSSLPDSWLLAYSRIGGALLVLLGALLGRHYFL